MDGKALIAEQIELIVIFGILSLAIIWYAGVKGFFSLPSFIKPARPEITIKQVILAFGIYLGTILFAVPLFAKLFLVMTKHTKTFASPIPVSSVAWIQFIGISLAIFFLFLFCRCQNSLSMKKIWKDSGYIYSRSVSWDFGMGIVTWFISFPLVIVIGQIANLFIYLLFGQVSYEQVAVRYLKMALDSPSMLVVALAVIVIGAPFTEEFLFRGFLQTWFKERLGPKAAILLAALCFSIFHLAPSQGIGNISLAASLFTFACFLGFIYEKQRSLFAPVALHMLFNTVSAVRILLISET